MSSDILVLNDAHNNFTVFHRKKKKKCRCWVWDIAPFVSISILLSLEIVLHRARGWRQRAGWKVVCVVLVLQPHLPSSLSGRPAQQPPPKKSKFHPERHITPRHTICLHCCCLAVDTGPWKLWTNGLKTWALPRSYYCTKWCSQSNIIPTAWMWMCIAVMCVGGCVRFELCMYLGAWECVSLNWSILLCFLQWKIKHIVFYSSCVTSKLRVRCRPNMS